QLERGAKRYELANHLGNVLTVISDKKTAICTGNTFNYFAAERISATDYSPFGAPLAGRTWQASEYRFGFNGQEKDDEFKSEGNSITFEFRIHDPRLGKFLSVDPLCNEYPWNSSYAFCENRVIDGIDLEGLEWGGPLFFFARPTPVIRPVVEEFVKPIEVLPKSPEIVPEQFIKPTKNPFSPEQLANLNRGRKIENEQLMKNQLEKNSKPITVETKPGEKTTTIPDSYKNGGKQTVEIKNVKSQSLTRQLRAQKKISNDNGFKPELIINKDANISNPVKTSFEIKYYNIPIAPIDNTTVVPLLISKPNRGNSSSPQTWPQA
ncbi:MAG: putative toxin, partial [Flavobacterium sp.]